MTECDGGAASAGSAGASGGDASGASSGGDAGGGSAASANAISNGEVLGNCDHSSGGYLGDGCFHTPRRCAVPFHRWEIGNGGSQRKKTKSGKDKKYFYEQGMKVVVDQLNERKMSRTELDSFYDSLQDGVVEFDFIKKDGSKRHAIGTLNPDLMPSRQQIVKIYADQGIDLDQLEQRLQMRKDYMPYFWDLEKNGYRQFHVSRFEGITSSGGSAPSQILEVENDSQSITIEINSGPSFQYDDRGHELSKSMAERIAREWSSDYGVRAEYDPSYQPYGRWTISGKRNNVVELVEDNFQLNGPRMSFDEILQQDEWEGKIVG